MKQLVLVVCAVTAAGAMMVAAVTPRSVVAEENNPPIIINGVPVVLWEDTNRDGYFGAPISEPTGMSNPDIMKAGPSPLTAPHQPVGFPMLAGGAWGRPFLQSDQPKPLAIVIGPIPLTDPDAQYLMGGIWMNDSPLGNYLDGLTVKVWTEGGGGIIVLNPGEPIYAQRVTDPARADYCVHKSPGFDFYGVQIELGNVTAQGVPVKRYQWANSIDGQVWGWDSRPLISGNQGPRHSYEAICGAS